MSFLLRLLVPVKTFFALIYSYCFSKEKLITVYQYILTMEIYQEILLND